MTGALPSAFRSGPWPTQNRSILPVAGERTMKRFQTVPDGAGAAAAPAAGSAARTPRRPRRARMLNYLAR